MQLTIYADKCTYLAANATTTNYDSETFFRLKVATNLHRHPLISVPLSEIPDGAVIKSATFKAYWYDQSVGYDPEGQEVRLTRQRRADWVASQATWNVYKTSNNWGTAGCLNTTTDIDTAYNASTYFRADLDYGWMEWDVKSMVEHAIANSLDFNVLMRAFGADFNNAVFYSNNYATDTTKQPNLVIEYTIPSGWFMFL